MGWFGDDSDQAQAYDTVQNDDGYHKHESSKVHELLAGAAAFEAERAYRQHCEANGQPESHDMAKELLAGFTGAFIDKEVETRGLDFVDKEKAKYEARKQAEYHYEQNEM